MNLRTQNGFVSLTGALLSLAWIATVVLASSEDATESPNAVERPLGSVRAD